MDTKKIKQITEEFFSKMTISVSRVDVSVHESSTKTSGNEVTTPSVNVDIFIDDPKMIIGESGKTLLEVQRILKIILNKKLSETFYLNLDINGYKFKKISYLKDIAQDLAKEVIKTKEVKPLKPMPAYERRILHKELSEIEGIVAQSQGEGVDRHIVISPKL